MSLPGFERLQARSNWTVVRRVGCIVGRTDEDGMDRSAGDCEAEWRSMDLSRSRAPMAIATVNEDDRMNAFDRAKKNGATGPARWHATVAAVLLLGAGTVPALGQNAPLQLIPTQPAPADPNAPTVLDGGIEVRPLTEETTPDETVAPPADPAPGTAREPAAVPAEPAAPVADPAPVTTGPTDATSGEEGDLAPATATEGTSGAPSTGPGETFTFDPNAPMPDGPIAPERLDAARDRVEERAATRVLNDEDLRERPVTELLNILSREGYVELRGITRTATGYRIDAVNRNLEAVAIEFDPTTGVVTERLR